MTYENASKYLMRFIEQISSSIIPLYMWNTKKSMPEFVGSSVYCAIGDIHLLYTAKHVLLDINPMKPLIQYNDESMIELPYREYFISNDDELDIGIILLSGELGKWIPITHESFSLFTKEPGYQQILVGYPASYTKKSKRREQYLSLQGYLTNAADIKEYKRINIDPQTKFIVEFKKKNVTDERKQKKTFPDPNGMSGGAVFQINENNPTEIKLVGIMTDWDVNRQNAIIATRIESFEEMLSITKIQ